MSNHDTTDMWTTQFEMGYMRKKTGDEMKKAILTSYNPNPFFLQKWQYIAIHWSLYKGSLPDSIKKLFLKETHQHIN